MMARSDATRGFPSWLTSRLVLISLFFFVTACADDGCDCEGFEEAEFPEEHYDKTLPRGGQIRLTDSGFQFLEGQIPSLIEEVQPGGLSFCLPRDTSDNPSICVDQECDDGSPGCQVDLAIDDSSLEPVPSDTIEAGITIGGLGGQDDDGNWEDVIDIEYDAGIGTADCVIHFWEDGGGQQNPAQVDATVPITLSLDENAPTKDLRVDIGEIDMEDITEQIDYELTGGWECDAGDWFKGLFEGTINDQVNGTLEDTINEMEADQLCRACGDGEPSCPESASCQEHHGTDSCVYDDEDSCVPRVLGIEGDLMLGELLEGYGEDPEATTHVMGRAADHAEVDTGVSIGLRTGAQPADESRCVPVDPDERPSFDEITPSPEIYTDEDPDGDPFMMGIGIHRRTLEHAFWSTWASGALCLEIGSEDVDQLSSDGLGVFLPSLQDLSGHGSTMAMRLVPQEAPQVELGDNTVTEDGDSYAIDDPLMTIDWDSVDLHFYVYAHERFVRAFSLRTDITLPIAIAADGQGEIQPVIGDLEDAVGNIRAVRTELLEEDTDDLIDVIPTLVGFAAPSLADSIAEPIELPEFVGYQIAIEQDDITSVDKNKTLALFADLVEADAEALVSPLSPRIDDAEVDVEQREDSRVPDTTAYLDVSSDTGNLIDGDDTELEYSWRVDNGLWSMWHRTEHLIIDDAVLAAQGRHQIDVRARLRGAPETTSERLASTEVTVDYTAPEVTLEHDGSTVAIDAHDVVDERDDLTYRYRIVGEGGWSNWRDLDDIDLRRIDAPASANLVVQVRDRAGHTTDEQIALSWQPNNYDGESSPPEESADGPSAGCQSSGSGAPGAGLMGLALLVLIVSVWRRRRRFGRAGGALLLAACLLAAGGCKDDTSSSEGACDGECAEGEECIEQTCYPEDEICEEDDDCECGSDETASCSDEGLCECTAICEDDCGDDGFCCHESESCQTFEDLCEDYECDEGFEPEALDDPSPDADSCEANGDACECVALPPLDLGRHGPYAAAAESDDVRAVSVYNKTYGDLMVGLVDDDETVEWHFVDGVPDSGEVEGALDGPRGGISDQGDDVGTHTAIAIDQDDSLHVLYRDEDERTLEYARGIADGDDYDFETTTLDEEGDTGYYTSALIADDAVHAVYTSAEVDTDEEGWQSQLRYISFPVDAEFDDLGLEPEVVHSAVAQNPCGSDCEGDEECFVEDATCAEAGDGCGDDGCDDGQECLEGSCEEIYEDGHREYPKVAAFSTQWTTTESGLAVIFTDTTRDSVGWTRLEEDQWEEPEFLGEPSGPYASGAFDGDDHLHLAYMNTEERTLVYEEVDQADPETIADGVRDGEAGYVQADIGEDVTLRLDEEDTPFVLYQDATWHRLYFAERREAEDWSTETLSEAWVDDDYEGSAGFFAAMPTASSESRFAVEYVIDNQADEPTGSARITLVP